jgi:hypothetical protein
MAQRQPTADERNATIDSYLETVVIKFLSDNDNFSRSEALRLIAKRAIRRGAQGAMRGRPAASTITIVTTPAIP